MPTNTQNSSWFDAIIYASIRGRVWVLLLVFFVAMFGVYNYQRLAIDAVPDITNVQVQINTQANGFTAAESEQRITYPIETAMAGLPDLEQTRSLSRYGLSQVTVIFKDGTDIYFARQLINQRLQEVKDQLPSTVTPVMAPVSTGLGEIYQWVILAEKNAKKTNGQPYSEADLREIQDWVVRPQLRQIAGVAEINTIGGQVREYHIVPNMQAMASRGISLEMIHTALLDNENRGAGVVNQHGQALTVRVPAQLNTITDIAAIPIVSNGINAVVLSDVAEVRFGEAPRSGAATYDGQQHVLGTAMMMSGANSRAVAEAIHTKIPDIQRSLPQGVKLETVYNRSVLVDKAIATVQKNLVEGALLVIVILFLFLGNVRAALITAAVIPLSMLMTFTGMVENGISANLMSLGALDFGIIIDGAVVIVENCLRQLAHKQHELGRLLTLKERLQTVFEASKQARRPLLFGQLIILVVYLPIFALSGVEAKLFHPMAATVVIALISAMILSITFVPAAVALLVSNKVEEKDNRLMRGARNVYNWVLHKAFANTAVVLTAGVCMLVLSGVAATRIGVEFAPTLSEGDIAIQTLRAPSTSLEQSLSMQQSLEKTLLAQFPHISHIYSRTGTAEVASDPMPPNISDTVVILKPKSEWPNGDTLETLKVKMTEVVNAQVGGMSEFSQPIEMRFNELISGVRSDLGVKLYGDDLTKLNATANDIAKVLQGIQGATAVKVEQTKAEPIVSVTIDRLAAARYGLSVSAIQDSVATAIGGMPAGQILEGDRRFDVVIRNPVLGNQPTALQQLPLALPQGGNIQLAQVATVAMVDAPSQISRENGKRRVIVTANIDGRDLGSFIKETQQTLASQIKLPEGYWIDYGGQFENLQSAQQRLSWVIPLAVVMVLLLLLAMFGNLKDSLLVFTGIPFALTGGIWALLLRDIPFSVSAGVGFIALSGVAVLNGLVMLSFINQLRAEGVSLQQAITQGALSRLRPVLMTALVASLGFIPMAIATGTGAEVQRPLATVVIGGILSSTLLTLVLLPLLYGLVSRERAKN